MRIQILVVATLFTFTLSHADAQQETPTTTPAQLQLTDLSVDPEAKDLEAEIAKAKLLVELRESYLNEAQEATALRPIYDKGRELRSRLKTMQVELDNLESKIKNAETEANGTSRSEVQLQELKRNQGLLTRNIAVLEKECEKASDEMNDATGKQKFVIQRAEIATRLAKIQLEQLKDEQANRAKAVLELDRKASQMNGLVAPEPTPPLETVGLTKEDLADCKLHVIGLYRAASEQGSDEVFVEVEDLKEPSIVVISAYSQVHWRLRLKNSKNVKLVIITGYFQQSADVMGSAPILNLTYFQKGNRPSKTDNWAYAYNWPTAEGRKMANMLYDVTGQTVDTFQGMQSAKRVVIDGKKGQLTNRQSKEPIEGLLTDEERAAEPIEFPTADATENQSVSSEVETELDELYAAEASAKIQIRKHEADLADVQAKLSAIQKKIQTASQSDGDANRETLRKQLADQFDFEQNERKARIDLAITKLQMVQVRRMLRGHDREKIIDERLESIAKETE